MKMYDYLVVGAGLFGAVFAHEAALKGKKVKVIEKRDHIAGNIYTKEMEGIQVHMYGAHIFHTSDKEIWDYVNQFAEFNRYTNSPIANYKGEIYNLPFNMNTFNKLWGVITPEEAQAKIEEQRAVLGGKRPENLEEQAISLVGTDIYEKLIKHYTEKQWEKPCVDLPAFIIRRLPVRLTYDNNYFNDTYQGIPIGGYTQIVEKMLNHENIDVEVNVDFFANKEKYLEEFPKIVFTGMIDEFFDYKLGELEYRSLRFETETLDTENYQGNAVVNYTDSETPYTRVIEHKHFEFGKQDKTIITREYSKTWKKGDEPYYPVNNSKNNDLYAQYRKLAEEQEKVIFGGRLGQYRYYDMHQVIAAALQCVRNEFA
ncbi:UDP-galactopyranose mutase [Enterococcus cecorum]|nr:UDP-galactopyranose mutase [Enterococcus cecorum]